MTAVFDQFLIRATHLRLDLASGVPKPYKPAMLIAAILLVQKGQPQDNLLMLGEMREAFAQVMRHVAPRCIVTKETAELPFRHLENDGVWQLLPRPEWRAEFERLQGIGARARDLAKRTLGARMQPDVFERLRDSTADAERAVMAIFMAYVEVFRAHGMDAEHAAVQLSAWLPGHGDIGAPAALADRPTLTERAVENYIEANWPKTPFGHYDYIGRQVMTPVNAIDILAADTAAQAWVVIELKCRDGDDRVVGQLSRYRGWIARERAADDLAKVRGVIVTDVVTERLEMAVRTQVGVEIWRYDDQMRFERA